MMSAAAFVVAVIAGGIAAISGFGIGSLLELFGHWNASVDVAMPAISQSSTHAGHPFVTFRVFADF